MYIQKVSPCIHNVHTVNPPHPCLSVCTKKQKENKSYTTAHTLKHTNERRSQGALTSVLTIARGKTENRNKTETVCSLDIHDNNKLMEFTSHILFILFDRVVGDLHGREILERVQNILDVWMKEAASSKACWVYVFICHILMWIRDTCSRPLQCCSAQPDTQTLWRTKSLMSVYGIRSGSKQMCIF